MINPQFEFDFDNIAAEQVDPKSWKLVLTVPENLSYFKGHFPDHAILPAVAVIDATIEDMRKIKNNASIDLNAVNHSKFLKPILPKMKIVIFGFEKNEENWRWEWKSQEETVATLDLTFSF